MKPSHKTTFSRKPNGEMEVNGATKLQGIVVSCFNAFVFNIRQEAPAGLEKLFSDDAHRRIVMEVATSTRMVSFINYHGDHMSLDITFSKGGTDVKLIRVRFDFSQERLIFISEITL